MDVSTQFKLLTDIDINPNLVELSGSRYFGTYNRGADWDFYICASIAQTVKPQLFCVGFHQVDPVDYPPVSDDIVCWVKRSSPSAIDVIFTDDIANRNACRSALSGWDGTDQSLFEIEARYRRIKVRSFGKRFVGSRAQIPT